MQIRAAGVLAVIFACASVLTACSSEPPNPAPVEFKAGAGVAAAAPVFVPPPSAGRQSSQSHVARLCHSPRHASPRHQRKSEMALVHFSAPKHAEYLPIPGPAMKAGQANNTPRPADVIPLDDPAPNSG